MTGQMIAILGPSGAGKDSLIDGLCASRPELYKARRVITRPESLGGEDFEGVTQAQFEKLAQNGAFCLHWEAHGNRYGVRKDIISEAENGRDVIFNGSRAMLDEARNKLPRFLPIYVHVSPDVLAQRLQSRGRETAEEIETRLERAGALQSQMSGCKCVDNSGAIEDTIAQALAIIDGYA